MSGVAPIFSPTSLVSCHMASTVSFLFLLSRSLFPGRSCHHRNVATFAISTGHQYFFEQDLPSNIYFLLLYISLSLNLYIFFWAFISKRKQFLSFHRECTVKNLIYFMKNFLLFSPISYVSHRCCFSLLLVIYVFLDMFAYKSHYQCF